MGKYHFIAIGGSAMHNLALALHEQGHQVTGSDDEIYEPSRSRLKEAGLLPPQVGWFPEKITPDLDGIILGKHAHADNPELQRAKELGLKIYSYPSFLYEHAKDKKRIVIGGSHGKTTTTSMLLHALRQAGLDTDFMVGSQIKGFDRPLRLSAEAPMMVLEGDEYPTSALDMRPKFFLYQPHIAVLTGVALDHINVFKDWETYKEQFRRFIDEYIRPGGILIYNSEDETLRELAGRRKDITYIPYKTPDYEVKDRRFYVLHNGKAFPMKVFGAHNMQNMAAAAEVAALLGIDREDFYRFMTGFEGASLRLEPIYAKDNKIIIRDFAHAPSKVKASVKAVREMYPDLPLKAVLELHTYSSLNKRFIPEYRGALDPADVAAVFYSPHAVAIKRLEPVEPSFIKEAFGRPDLQVFTSPADFHAWLFEQLAAPCVLLLMSSGNLGGLDLEKLKQQCDALSSS